MRGSQSSAKRLFDALKNRDKGMYPEGPNPDIPWISITAKYLPQTRHWLDVGCRTGFYIGESVRMAGKCPDLSVSEKDPEMLKYAKDYLESLNINPRITAFSDLDKAEGGFDLLTCRDEKPPIETIKHLLAPDGIYIQFFPVRDLEWSQRVPFVLSRNEWLSELAVEMGLEPVEAKGWGSKWSTNIDTLVNYLEVTEDRTITDQERDELLRKFEVGAGVCVEEFGQFAVLKKS